MAGLLAGLVSLVGFGLDSGVESGAAVLIGLRLGNGEADERKERFSLKAVAVTFFLLAAYVVVGGVRDLIRGEKPDTSVCGLGPLVASIIVMPLLARAKRRVAMRHGGDKLILADAAESRICLPLSISMLAGLVLYAITGAAWLDPVAGFVVAIFAIYEGREA